jgi:hypothetical protein
MADRRITGPVVVESPLPHQSRAIAVAGFLANEDLGPYLLMIDGDMVVSPDLARALVTAAGALGLDVVCQTYATRRGTCEACRFDPEANRPEDLAAPEFGTVVPCDFVGFGAVLLCRELLARMWQEYGHLGSDALFAPLARRATWGEDYAFCWRARAVGASIATANLTHISHLKMVPLTLRGTP